MTFIPSQVFQEEPTVYDTPKEPLINFPSSIMNGITKEGGLVSLTFKSITCVELLEKSDWMRSAILRSKDKYEALRIKEDKFDGEKMKCNLENEFRVSSDEEEMRIFESISNLQKDITQCLSDKADLNLVTQEIGKFDRNLVNNIELRDGDYDIKKSIDIPNLKVDSIDDVKNLDFYPYNHDSEKSNKPDEVNESNASITDDKEDATSNNGASA